MVFFSLWIFLQTPIHRNALYTKCGDREKNFRFWQHRHYYHPSNFLFTPPSFEMLQFLLLHRKYARILRTLHANVNDTQATSRSMLYHASCNTKWISGNGTAASCSKFSLKSVSLFFNSKFSANVCSIYIYNMVNRRRAMRWNEERVSRRHYTMDSLYEMLTCSFAIVRCRSLPNTVTRIDTAFVQTQPFPSKRRPNENTSKCLGSVETQQHAIDACRKIQMPVEQTKRIQFYSDIFWLKHEFQQLLLLMLLCSIRQLALAFSIVCIVSRYRYAYAFKSESFPFVCLMW